jgi:hypothetical protein
LPVIAIQQPFVAEQWHSARHHSLCDDFKEGRFTAVFQQVFAADVVPRTTIPLWGIPAFGDSEQMSNMADYVKANSFL